MTMRLGMYAVKDRAADAYIAPFFLPTDSVAIREFSYAATIPDHKFGKHPYDFGLYKLGEFEIGTGRVSVLSEPLFLINAAGDVGPQTAELMRAEPDGFELQGRN